MSRKQKQKTGRNSKRMVRIQGRDVAAREFTLTEEAMRDRIAAAKRRRVLDEQRVEA